MKTCIQEDEEREGVDLWISSLGGSTLGGSSFLGYFFIGENFSRSSSLKGTIGVDVNILEDSDGI